MLRWPTSELPIWPSGRPTFSPSVRSSACGYFVANSPRRCGLTLPITSALSPRPMPQPSRIMSKTFFRAQAVIALSPLSCIPVVGVCWESLPGLLLVLRVADLDRRFAQRLFDLAVEHGLDELAHGLAAVGGGMNQIVIKGRIDGRSRRPCRRGRCPSHRES